MGVPAFRFKSKFGRRCDKCSKPSHEMYRMNLGQFTYTFCSGMCAESARSEYEKKDKLGLTPSNPEPIDDFVQAEDDPQKELTIDDFV